MEVNLAAGVYVTEVSSNSHAIAAERTGPDSFHVQLADTAVRPNKDFILKYKVAGAGITHAVLTHPRSSGGDFTLVLPPPDPLPDTAPRPPRGVFVPRPYRPLLGCPLVMAAKA